MRRSAALATLALLVLAAPAMAQPSAVPALAPPGGPGATPPTPPAGPDTPVAPAAEIPQAAAAAPQVSTPAEQFVDGDASSDHAYLSPTGFTAKRGTAGVQVWAPAIPMLMLAAATYSLTDRIEISAGGAAELGDGLENNTVGYVSAKVQVLRRRTTGVSVQAQYLGADGDSLTVLTGAASQCLGASYRTVATLHLSLFPTSSFATPVDGMSGTAVHVLAGGSLVTGKRIKLVVDTVVLGEGGDHGLVVYGGLRMARHKWAADLGFVGFTDGDESDLLPMPLASGALRF